MEQVVENGNKLKFTLPDGKHWVEIREQNGADDDKLSNVGRANELMNICDFISAIVVNSDLTSSGKLTPDEVSTLPVLSKYLILFRSRIHSLGPVVNFSYTWPDGLEENYEEDLNNLIFSDYSKVDEEEILNKPYAIPYYMGGLNEDGYSYFTTTTGKELRYKPLDTLGERYISNLGNNYTKNEALKARNLQMKSATGWDKVENFFLFNVREMAQIRQEIATNDPEFTGVLEIESSKGQKTYYSILMAPSFFYLGEI